MLFCLASFFYFTATQDEIVSTEVPYYNYGSGIGISSDDSLFLINIRFRIQNRFTYDEWPDPMGAKSKQASAEIRRLRLRLDGFFFRLELIYIFQLGCSDPDIRSPYSEIPCLVKDAVIFYRFSRNFNIVVGRTNLPRNRSSVISTGDLEFVDRSLLKSTFKPTRDFGAQSYFYNNFNNVYFSLRGVVTAGTR